MMSDRAVAGLLIGLALVLGSWGTARANPIPEYMFFSHVQPVDGDFCSEPPIESCNELVQATTLRGPLEFDVFVSHLYSYDEPCADFAVNVEWDAGWTLLSADACGAPGSSFTHEGNTGALRIPSLDGLSGPAGFKGLGRVILDVASPGWFRITGVEDCLNSEFTDVRAGLACGECSWPCSWGPFGLYGPSSPHVDPAELEVQAETGRSAAAEIDVGLWDIRAGEEFSFVSAESWLLLEPRLVSPPVYFDREYRVMVTASAHDLDPGVYEGWIEAQRMRCSECAHVIFTVLPETATEPESWGSLKSRFRVATR